MQKHYLYNLLIIILYNYLNILYIFDIKPLYDLPYFIINYNK